jgi:hypothetical protein
MSAFMYSGQLAFLRGKTAGTAMPAGTVVSVFLSGGVVES